MIAEGIPGEKGEGDYQTVVDRARSLGQLENYVGHRAVRE